MVRPRGGVQKEEKAEARGGRARGCHEGSLFHLSFLTCSGPTCCFGVYLYHRLARASFLLSDGTGVLKGRQIAAGKWAVGGGCMGIDAVRALCLHGQWTRLTQILSLCRHASCLCEQRPSLSTSHLSCSDKGATGGRRAPWVSTSNDLRYDARRDLADLGVAEDHIPAVYLPVSDVHTNAQQHALRWQAQDIRDLFDLGPLGSGGLG